MLRTRLVTLILAIAVPLLFPDQSAAQLGRTAVSVNGSDANNCAVLSPCRSINQAVSQTATGGEVIVLDSAGYGPFTVGRAMTVQAAPGVYAGITAQSGDGVTVNLPTGSSAKVVLRGLTINGLGTGSAGILFSGGDSGTELHVENCVISNFANWGILSFLPLRVQDTVIRNTGWGIQIDNAGAAVDATLERVQIKRFVNVGVLSWRNSKVTAREVVVTLGNIALWATDGGALNIHASLAAENSTGVSAAINSSGGTVRLSDTMLVNNATGVAVGGGTVNTFSNNRIRGNTTDVSGTLTPLSPM